MDGEMPGQAEASPSVSQQRSTEKSVGDFQQVLEQFEQAVGDFHEVFSPGAAGRPDKLATSSMPMDTSPSSPMLSGSSPMSPVYSGAGHGAAHDVRVTSDDEGHLELVTKDKLERQIERLTLCMHTFLQKEFASFESNLDLQRHMHDQRALAERVDGLERQFAEQEQRVAQELDQLGQTSGQALGCLQHLGPRLDRMLQDHKETVEALEMADQQMVKRLDTFDEQVNLLLDSRKGPEQGCNALKQQVDDLSSQMQQVTEESTRLWQHVDTEMLKLEDMLHGAAPSVETDLQNIFQEMEDLKGKLHILNQVQLQDQNDFNEVDMFQKELCQRVNDEMALLRGKVDGVTDMVQEDLMGLHSKLASDIKHLQADREAAPIVFDWPNPSIGAFIVEEPPALEEAAGDDDCMRDLQHRSLEAEPGAHTLPGEQPPKHNEQPPEVVLGDPPPLAGGHLAARLEERKTMFLNTFPVEATGDSVAPPSPEPALLGLAELQRTMDKKLDMSLKLVDDFISRHEDKLQQLGDVGSRYSEVQRSVDGLREEIGTVRDKLDELSTDKVLTYLRAVKDTLNKD